MRKTRILRRILNFLSEWDQKQKEREIERLISRSGGRLTDDLERRIFERTNPRSIGATSLRKNEYGEQNDEWA